MQLLEAVESRRSVKHYDPSFRLSDEEIKDIFSKVILSPTSFNMQNWRFLIVTDEEEKKEIQAAAWNQEQITQSAFTVLVCADLNAWAKEPSRYWRNAPEPVQNTLVPMIGKFYQGNEQLQRDEAMRSVGIASQTIMLIAKDKGLDTCPMIGFDPVKVAEIVKLPEDHVIGMLITVGKAAQPARERGGQLELSEVINFNSFN